MTALILDSNIEFSENKLNNMYHKIITKLIYHISHDKFYELPLIIMETVEDITNDKGVTSNEKLNLAKDALEYSLIKSKLMYNEKKYTRDMFPLMTESLIFISNKKYKLRKNGNIEKKVTLVYDEIYNKIKNEIEEKYNINSFTNLFFKVILVIINDANNYKNILNHQKKIIVVNVINNLVCKINQIFNNYNKIDIDRIIFFNRFTSSYIENVFRIYKNKTRLNTHKQIFKSQDKPLFK